MRTRLKQRSSIAQRVFLIVVCVVVLLLAGLAALSWWIYQLVDAGLAQLPVPERTWDAAQALLYERGRLLIPLAVALVVLCLWLARQLLRWTVRPLSQLVDAALAAGGEQSARNLPVRASGEVGEIARSFNDLSASLQRSLRELDEQNRVMNETVRRLEGMLQIGQELNVTLDAGQLLRHALETLRTTFGYERPGAALLEEDGLLLLHGRSAEPGAPQRLPFTDQSIVARVARSARLLRADDLQADSLYTASYGALGVRSELAVPVLSERKVLAVLLVQSSERRAFSERDEAQLSALAGLLAVALANSNRFRAEQLRRQLAEAIYRVSHTLSAALASERVSELVLDQLAQVLPYDRSALLLIDSEYVETTAARGFANNQVLAQARTPLKDVPLIAEIAARGDPVVLDDAQLDLRYRPMIGSSPARSWLGAPLLRQGQVSGVLILESDQPNRYSEEELHAITAVANQAVIAMESARLYAAAQERNQRLEVIAGITKMISTRDVSRDLHGVLRTIIHLMRRVVPCDYAALAIYNEEEDTFSVETVYDYAVHDWSQLPAGQRIAASQTPWQTACRTNGPVIQSELERSVFDEDQRLARRGLRSSVVVPIIGASRAFGALNFASHRPGAYAEAQIATLLELSLYLGPVLHNARLAREREETAVKLARTQEHLNLVDKVRTVGQLASGVAHDFNNLLAGILGNAQLLLFEIRDPEQREMLQVIERAAKDGTETVRRLQGFARMEHDSPMIEVRLDMLARDAIDITRPRWRDVAQSRGASIEIVRQLQPVTPIAGRPAELREVLTNLIINAVDAMPQGGQITVATYDDSLTGEGAGMVVVEVADTGIGMPPEVASRVFDPFFTTKGEQGTGIGLAVSLGIVQSHGGQIEIESALGSGTRFIVRLPVRVAEMAKAHHERADAPVVPGHILFVEGETMIRRATARLLTRWGHKVTEASGGIEALHSFAPDTYDVVISDLGMPDMSGWDLLAEIKQRDQRVPTILITGWGRQYSEEELHGRGVDYVIEKPFDQHDLHGVIAEALSHGARVARS